MIGQHQITNAGHHQLKNSNVQRILDPGAVDGNFSPIPEQQFHAAGVHVEMASSCIVLHVRFLSALRHLYSCDFRYTFFLLVRFWTHSGWKEPELVGARPLHLAGARPLCRLKAPLGLLLPRLRRGRAVQVPLSAQKNTAHKVCCVFSAVKQSKSEPFPFDAASAASPKVTVCVPSL